MPSRALLSCLPRPAIFSELWTRRQISLTSLSAASPCPGRDPRGGCSFKLFIAFSAFADPSINFCCLAISSFMSATFWSLYGVVCITSDSNSCFGTGNKVCSWIFFATILAGAVSSRFASKAFRRPMIAKLLLSSSAISGPPLSASTALNAKSAW